MSAPFFFIIFFFIYISFFTQVVGEEGVYECAICGAQFPGINMLGQHCQVLQKLCKLACFT